MAYISTPWASYGSQVSCIIQCTQCTLQYCWTPSSDNTAQHNVSLVSAEHKLVSSKSTMCPDNKSLRLTNVSFYWKHYGSFYHQWMKQFTAIRVLNIDCTKYKTAWIPFLEVFQCNDCIYVINCKMQHRPKMHRSWWTTLVLSITIQSPVVPTAKTGLKQDISVHLAPHAQYQFICLRHLKHLTATQWIYANEIHSGLLLQQTCHNMIIQLAMVWSFVKTVMSGGSS